MRLPKDLLSGNYTKPRIFLCETDKQRIAPLETINTNGSFKFNSYSEISFEVARTYNDLITGQTKVSPFYDKIEALRLIELENIGFFEIQGPDLSSDGIKESKSITAYSLEYTLSQKYLEDFYTVNGRDEWAGSLEDLWQVKKNDFETVPKIVLYNPHDTDASVLHLILEKVYGWKIGYVDKSLWSLSRAFDVDRESVYDFIINEICEKFNCYAVFDTINNEINLYAESQTSKFIGDGTTKEFIISPPFGSINTVSIGGYKTTQWEYDASTGALTLAEAPTNGEMVEVIDGAMTDWETDVFVTFDNLSQEIRINYDAESIKTVLTVSYGDDGNIREVNLGLPYLVDISYYYTPEWMGQDLYDAYTLYLQKTNQYQADFTANTQKRLELSGYKDYHEHRLALGYSVVQSVSSDTTGTYYVRGGDAPDYYYTEVSLPSEYKAGTTYYSMNTTNLSEDKVSNLYQVLKQYFNGNEDWKAEIDKLVRDFEFMLSPTLSDLKANLTNAKTLDEKDAAVLNFLNAMWEELGRTPLKELYLASYKTVQTTNMSMDEDTENGTKAGNWSDPKHENYWFYYPVTLMISSIEAAIAKRDKTIQGYQDQIDVLNRSISAASDDLLIANNFTEDQLIRLNAFLREDELQLDDIVETDLDSLEVIYDTKQDAMESGRIELQKLCQPQLQFSMTMANIYALPEFEPIVGQFQLGNVIKVALRPDYIKQSRLLQVDINFDDFSDFSCEFGDLTSLRTQSDIHADLLKKAVTAGKSVATNASYWTKGSNQATVTDLKIEQGLLDAATQIKSTDGTQGVVIDKYGIKLQKDAGNGEIDPEQVWLVNNQIVFTDDNFKTSKSALGKVTVDGKTYFGLISEIVLAGYIEGSKVIGSEIEGGTIKIGEEREVGAEGARVKKHAFEVDEFGNVSMLWGEVEFKYNKKDDTYTNTIVETTGRIQDKVTEIEKSKMYRVEVVGDGPTTITTERYVEIPDITKVTAGTYYTRELVEGEYVYTAVEILDPSAADTTREYWYDNGGTTLMCKVYSWDTDITNDLIASGVEFHWTRTSTGGAITDEEKEIVAELDAVWNANNIKSGEGANTIIITADDVLENSSFACTIKDLPDLEYNKEE